MTITTPRFQIVPYGEVSKTVQALIKAGRLTGTTISTATRQPVTLSRRVGREFWVASSRDINQAFTQQFQRSAMSTARLLVLNESRSSDNLLARLIQLPIRSPERVCVVDLACGSGKTHLAVNSLLQRLVSLARMKQNQDDATRILDAKINEDVLHVVSLSFRRLDIPLKKIASLASDPAGAQECEIDPDGSFIYWPRLDVHLGWAQLQQILDPVAAHRAQQKSREFNIRYGKAVQKVREKAGLKLTDFEGISEKQVRRIENGNCRLTTNAIQVLSKAHKLTANEYLERLAGALE